MTRSAAAIYFCNRSQLRAAAVALSLAAVATMPAGLRGAEPDFERAEIWIGGQRVQSATVPVDRSQRAVVYINGQRIDPLARLTETPAATATPQSQPPAPLPGLPAEEQAPIESSGPLVIEFPTSARAPAPARSSAPATIPLPDEATVAPATPSLASRNSSGDVQPAILTVPQGASPSNVELTAGFSAASQPRTIAPLAVETPRQPPSLLSGAEQQTARPVHPAPLFAAAPVPRAHVGQINLSPTIFIWPLVIGLLLVFYVQRMAANKRGA